MATSQCMNSSSKLETMVNRCPSNSGVNGVWMKIIFIIEASLLLFSICSTKRARRSPGITSIDKRRKRSGWAISRYFDETMVNERIMDLSKCLTTSTISSVGSLSIMSVVVQSKFEHMVNEANHGLGTHRIKVNTVHLHIHAYVSPFRNRMDIGMGRQSKSAADIASYCCNWT